MDLKEFHLLAVWRETVETNFLEGKMESGTGLSLIQLQRLWKRFWWLQRQQMSSQERQKEREKEGKKERKKESNRKTDRETEAETVGEKEREK